MYSILHGNDNQQIIYDDDDDDDDDDIAPSVLHLYVRHSELREVKIQLLFSCGIEIQKLFMLIYR